MQEILDAIQGGASGDDIAALAIPESYRAAFVRREDIEMFEGVESWDKDPRKSLHVDDVATPELAPDLQGPPPATFAHGCRCPAISPGASPTLGSWRNTNGPTCNTSRTTPPSKTPASATADTAKSSNKSAFATCRR